MLAVPADRLPTALADLDPGNRALLDLSLRRGVSDAEIGELLRKEPDEVARGREAVLGLLADALAVDGHDRRERVRRAVAELPDDAWRAAPSRPEPEVAPDRGPDEDEADDGDEDEAEPPLEEGPTPAAERQPPAGLAPRGAARPEQRDEPRRSRGGRLLALLAVVIVVGGLIALIAGGGDDDSDEPKPQANQQEPAPAPADGGKKASLAVVGGGAGSGSVSVTPEGKLVVTLKGLPKPAGTYQVWLYNSIDDAIQLGTFHEGSGRLEVRLPAKADRYRDIDISAEPADSNRNHSGDTVMRVPVAKLLPR